MIVEKIEDDQIKECVCTKAKMEATTPVQEATTPVQESEETNWPPSC